MIYKGARKTKMGANISKRKEKKEGLMSQMKSTVEAPPIRQVSPSPSICQTPPPRNLATSLATPALSQEFLAFLGTMDAATGLEEGECGRADTLQFILEVRALEGREGEVAHHSFRRYFPGPGSGLVLENQELWKECASVVACTVLSVAGRRVLEKASMACCGELEPLHVLFLSQRKQPSAVCQIISCIL